MIDTEPERILAIWQKHPFRGAVVGVLAHNEDPTIETCLRAILAEDREGESVRSVVVVASGCTDRTEDIVKRVAEEDRRVRLIIEKERTGKAAAINLLLRETSEPIVVVIGGDVVFTTGSLVRLLEPFEDLGVGMTGARPVPTNPRAGILGRAVNVLWDWHHELSVRDPKLGEAVAFRRLFEAIDRDTLVDEATLEHLMMSLGLRLEYVPKAIVRNHGPETLREYIAQRARVYVGHLQLAEQSGYRVSSMNSRAALAAGWRLWRRGERATSIILTVGLEAIARGRAQASHRRSRNTFNAIWRPIITSKRVVSIGHVLRAHHEDFHEIDVRFKGFRVGAANRRLIRQLIRVDDHVRFSRGGATITIRGDQSGAAALRDRLEASYPGQPLHPRPRMLDAPSQSDKR